MRSGGGLPETERGVGVHCWFTWTQVLSGGCGWQHDTGPPVCSDLVPPVANGHNILLVECVVHSMWQQECNTRVVLSWEHVRHSPSFLSETCCVGGGAFD